MNTSTQHKDIEEILSQITLGSQDNKLSVANAIALGYRFVLGQDGEAQIHSPDGEVYYITGFCCECPDKIYREGSYDGNCKHEVWVYQVMPCPMCGQTMALGCFTTCFGEQIHRFECARCGHARDAKVVFQDRKRKLQPVPF